MKHLGPSDKKSDKSALSTGIGQCPSEKDTFEHRTKNTLPVEHGETSDIFVSCPICPIVLRATPF